ncbi:MAG: hypothetical protein ACHQPH_01075 [Reyranellales bacterium]|jgi:hypothetical protein
MDGRLRGVDGGLVVSRPAGGVKDTLAAALHYPVASVQVRIAVDADTRVLSAQYAGDTIVTSPLAGAARVLARNPMKNKTLASAVVDLAA